MSNGFTDLPPEVQTYSDDLAIIRFAIEFFYTLATDPSNIWQITVVGQIIEQLIQAFQGKPRELATITVAQRFMHSKNRVGQIAGQEILRLLHDQGIVLSSSDAASQRKIGWIRAQLHSNLMAQGLTLKQAVNVVDEVMDHTDSANQALPPPLDQKMPDDFKLFGPPQLNFDYQYQYDHELQILEQRYLDKHSLNDPSQIPAKDLADLVKQATQHALRELFNRDPMPLLWYLQFSKVPPTVPPLIGQNGNPPDHFPKLPVFLDPCQGEVNAATQSLKDQLAALQAQLASVQKQLQDALNQLANQTGGSDCSEERARIAQLQKDNSAFAKQVANLGRQINQLNIQLSSLQAQLDSCEQLNQPGQDGDGDQIEACCAQSITVLTAIATAITKIQFPAPQTDCCDQIVAAIENVITALGALAPTVNTPITVNVPPPDLSAIADALAKINQTIGSRPEEQPTDVSFLKKLVEEQPADQARIKALADRLQQLGIIDAAGAQLLTS